MKSFITAAVLTLGGLTAAQSQALPSAASLEAKFIQAIGGKDALASYSSRALYARIEIPSQGIKGPLVVWAKAPNKLATHTIIPGLGEVRSGFDGQTGWALNPAMGPMVMEGLALDQLRQQADFHGSPHNPKWVDSATTMLEEPFEGKPAYKVKVRTKWGEEYFEYYDKATGFLVGYNRKQDTPMGALEAVTVMTEWKPFGKVMMPTITRVKVMGIEQVVTADSVSTAEIPDSVFALPPEIQALKKGQ
jgi:hypothetical protein